MTTKRTTERGFFTGSDGLSLYYEQDELAAPRGAVLMLHGFAEHCGRYAGVAETLVERGLSVYRFDYRGHGRSGGRRGHTFAFGDYLHDVRAMRARIIAAVGTRPLFLAGHSFGGLISLHYASQFPEGLSGLALSSPFVGFQIKVSPVKAFLGRSLSRIVPTLSLPTDIDPALVSHDAEVVAEYARDPLVGRKASARWFTETLRAQLEAPERARALQMPVLVQQGLEDRIASAAATRSVYGHIGSPDKTLREYPDLFHEIWFEKDRRAVLEDLGGWFEAHLPA